MSVALAQAGAKVVGVARRSCEDTKKLIEADGGEFTEVIADLSDMAAIETIVNGALAAYGQVDILVNNAGLIKRNDAIDFTEDEWDSVIQVNQKMVFFLSQAFAKQYIKQGHGGKIININSMLSYQGGIRVPSYTASKSAGTKKGISLAGFPLSICETFRSSSLINIFSLYIYPPTMPPSSIPA